MRPGMRALARYGTGPVAQKNPGLAELRFKIIPPCDGYQPFGGVGWRDYGRGLRKRPRTSVWFVIGISSSTASAEIYEPTLRARSRAWPRRKWGPARAEAGPGRVATRGPGTARACPRDRRPRDGGVPRRPHRRRSARRRAAGWCPLPAGRRAALV